MPPLYELYANMNASTSLRDDRPAFIEYYEDASPSQIRIGLESEHDGYGMQLNSAIVQKELTASLASLYSEIGKLSKLPKGWDGYNAVPPKKKAVDNARKIIGALCAIGCKPDRITASVEGGVAILLLRNSRYANIEALNDGDIIVGVSLPSGPDVFEVNMNRLPFEMKRVLASIENRYSAEAAPGQSAG